jgi:sulfur-oxidizing protein SoxY
MEMTANHRNSNSESTTRRQVLTVGAGLVTCSWVPVAHAVSDDLQTTLNRFTGGAALKTGRVRLDIAPIVDNGNTVPITVTVDSPMSAAEHVTLIAVFNERNPQREVIQCRLSPRNGRASVSTRIRLATTQKLVAVARLSDGSWWSHTVDVIVAIAACIEDEG